jgi:hypothetical protein
VQRLRISPTDQGHAALLGETRATRGYEGDSSSKRPSLFSGVGARESQGRGGQPKNDLTAVILYEW